jgi:hypothetical protein
MARCRNDKGYDVYVQTKLKAHDAKPADVIWTLRTNGHCETSLEMAEALTRDLSRMNVAWQIRSGVGVVSTSEK